jgi:ABC-type transport system substrate-binding protein
MKKLLVPLAILLISAFIVAGCSSTTTPSTPAATSPTVTSQAISSPAAPAPMPTTGQPAAPHANATTPYSTAPATSQSSGNQLYGGTLRYIAGAGPGAPIGAPWLANGTSTFAMQFSEQFLLKEQGDASITPDLAASYDVVTDPANPSITLHLQKGV